MVLTCSAMVSVVEVGSFKHASSGVSLVLVSSHGMVLLQRAARSRTDAGGRRLCHLKKWVVGRGSGSPSRVMSTFSL